ncbi:hypothetical protein V1264_006825 [Littorina saxatilis]|uniref:Reverse transcriptase domain-containing protein n=1 Tax=Littorina saxatilis TaxID=31220 RepID=A0AAN9AXX3_9CAEN
METPATVREALRPGDWVTSVDLTDAYFHILMHEADRKWLRFLWGDRIFQFRALPFGLSLAPWVFTMVVRQLCALVRQHGVRLRAYLDDWLILHQQEALCLQHTQFVLAQAQDLGFRVNHTKSELTPSQTFTYLGMAFDSREWTVRPTQRRVDKLQALLSSLLGLQSAPARTLASVQGQMESMSSLIPLGRSHKRPFQAALSSVWNPTSQGWDVSVPLGVWFQQTTLQWMNTPWLLQGVPIALPPPSTHLFSDASQKGWGAHVDTHTTSGRWSQEQRLWHINRLELEAVFLGLQHFLSALQGTHVLIHTDNTTVAAYLNKQGGSRSQLLSSRACEILSWCARHQILVSARYLPGCLNVLADALSRSSQILHTEWTIAHQALLRLWAQVERPMVDLFATRFSRRLPIFVSPFPDPEAWKIDAMTISWTGLVAYAFPPTPLIGRVLRKADLERPRLLLVAPRWPSQHWFPDLLRLASGPPIPLSLRRGELLQPRTGILHDRPEFLDLHAWRLFGDH